MSESKDYFPSAPEKVGLSSNGKKKSKKWMNKRRFSDEQIKSLESMFETESKLEPRMKLKLARELDLKPRQVAIWFQNKRARWKSKQLEREYSVLKANYDALASQFESEKKEKQTLLVQLQKLHNLLGTPQDRKMGLDGNSTDGDTDNGGDTKYEFEEKPKPIVKGPERGAFSDSKDGRNLEYFIKGEADLTNVMESTGNWGSFDCSDPFDQSCSSSPWWEFWS